MLAAYAARVSADDPLSALEVGERPEPAKRDGWTTVTVKAASLNHHDLFALRGVALSADQTPIILGGDAAGIDEDGNEVVVHSVIGDPDAGGGDETLDPRRSLLSERYDGTLAELVSVPRRNLVPKPKELSFEEAACLPTAWLTAYKMLFSRAGVRPGDTVLVQGAGGGVATAAIALGRAAGLRVWATSRHESKRSRAVELGAHEVFESGAKLPGKVDAVLESVGAATWQHSLRSVRPGGRIVVCGATSGYTVETDLPRVFFTQVDILGSTMGTRGELASLLAFLVGSGVRPVIDSTFALPDARAGFTRLMEDGLFG
ncbi:MAG: zinc-binding dehydrogenase, partial [Frankiaceae bacterium]|nr:zinc-binding dehydrogenase [Frankiaceae bacterium]